MTRHFAAATAVVLGLLSGARAADWQWSVPTTGPGGKPARAYLWVPPDCRRVRAVVFANHNMIEQGILEHPAMRATLAKLSMAEVWVAPKFDLMFEFQKGAGEHYQKLMDDLAAVSGYDELSRVPAAPLGHSACASFPWNFAAWDKSRTLAVLSVKGDAPHTRLTGNGGPNADWGDHDIDGVPCLMVMSEYEWMEDRLMPLIVFRAQHPKVPVAFYFDAGRSHFDYSDDLVAFLAQFIEKAAAARLPDDPAIPLKPVDPQAGWLIARPNLTRGPVAPPAPFSKFKGEPTAAFFAFDEGMADWTAKHAADQLNKRPQLLGFVQDGQTILQESTAEQVSLKWQPEADGLTFKLHATFLDTVPAGSGNPAIWTHLPAGTPLGHATGGGPVRVRRDVGPFVQLDDETFRLQYGRAEYPDDGRNNDCWVWAEHPGDDEFEFAIQQAMLRVPVHKTGRPQAITFGPIAPTPANAGSVPLHATSDAGLAVQFYVREGPAQVDGDHLKLTAVPPRAKWPVRVTVVAWQPGNADVRAASRVEQTFDLTPGAATRPAGQ